MSKYKIDTEHIGLKVLEIIPNADQFNSNGVKYCHYYKLHDPDGGYILQTQVCTDSPNQNFCKVNDVVNIKIKHYHEKTSVYTLYFIQSDSVASTVGKDYISGPPMKNTMVSGSAAALALTESMKFHIEKSKVPFSETSIDDVLNTADTIFEWLIDKNKK